jgi:carboxypeptidase Taq
MSEQYAVLRKLLGEIFDLESSAGVLSWDQQTYMPAGGTETRAMQLATLSRLAHEKFTSDEMGAALEAAKEEVTGLDQVSDEARLIRKAKRDFDKLRKVPSDWVSEFTRTTSIAHPAWEKARAETDFSQFLPHLEKILKLRRQYVRFFEPYDHPYDPLLDDFEPGMKTSEVKAVFDQLRPQQVELVHNIGESGHAIDDSMLHLHYDEKKQWDFGVEVIKAYGFDFERGRQDKSAHPFTSGFGTGDVRITTRFDLNFFNTAIFSTLHEAGHALYALGTNPAFNRTPLIEGASLAIHESQSRLWENLVGRSRPFWIAFYDRLQEIFPSQLENVELETFYQAVNKVEPSLIRVEADEATYNLHIMLRFEIELALVEGRLTAGDLPEAWNNKMEEYLGLRPPDDALGVLQDVHWSAGMIGYFPTYALGNVIAVQLWTKIKEDLPDLDRQIERKEFGSLLAWLREHVHRHGAKFEPIELLQRITGSGLTAEPYLQYLLKKFGEIYGIA